MLCDGPGGTEGTSLGGRIEGKPLKDWAFAATAMAASHKPVAKTNWTPRPRLVPAILMAQVFDRNHGKNKPARWFVTVPTMW